MCALAAKDALQVKILRPDAAADLAGAVVVDARATHAVARIGDIELVPHAPRPVRLDLRAFIGDVAAAQVALDERGNGAALDKARQHQRP